jgi:hypothetical protein
MRNTPKILAIAEGVMPWRVESGIEVVYQL